MRSTIPGCAALALIAVAACSDIGAPIRDDLYEWRLIVSSGAGPDTIHFHWAREQLPVRVWVAQDDLENLPSLVQRAIDTWESVYLYREFQGEVVSDSNTAHVIVRGVAAPAKVIEDGAVRLSSAFAPECGGATDLEISDDLSELTLPIRIFIDPRAAIGSPGLDACLALTSIHEVGHALGIFNHSPNPTDIMFADPQVEQPSLLDRETAEALYHIPPTVEAIGR